MKREELLRQLDQDIESLKGCLEDVSHRLWEFEAEETEKQRVPKWVMYPKKTSSLYLTPGKWYRVIGSETQGRYLAVEFITDSGIKAYSNLKGSAHIDGGDWELWYGDNPPEAKQERTRAQALMDAGWVVDPDVPPSPRILGPEEIMQKGDFVVEKHPYPSFTVMDDFDGKRVNSLYNAYCVVRFKG
jgi:hypothetical protein